MTEFTGLLILGFGGHARSVADVALACGVERLIFFDVNARDGETFLHFPVLADLPSTLREGWACMPAAGDNCKRRLQILHAERADWPIAALVAPSATIGVGATLSKGCLVGHHAHVGPMAHIGEGCIINTGAVVEHECWIGNYVHVSVHATVAGRSRIGDLGFIGAGATVIDGVQVCEGVTIGAGSVVIDSVREEGAYAGVPIRRLRT